MRESIRRFFRFEENRTNFRREIIAGATTFMTMAYIIFVNPTILQAAGMDFNSVLVATCVSSAVAILFMAFLANYPIALAPGMGINAYFAYAVCQGMGIPWQTALGAVFLSGTIFLILAFFKVRELIINSVPESLKNAIAAGIGIMIAFVGLKEAGIIRAHEATFVTLGHITGKAPLLSLIGLFFTGLLLSRRVPGALLLGILFTAIGGVALGVTRYQGFFSLPPSVEPTFLKLDILGALKLGLLTIIVVFLYVDMFDTVGTLIGVSQQAGFIKEGRLPRAERALISDAMGTVTGAVMGTSTVTSYIESAAGVAEGGRTGFANIITALLFLLALFLSPLARMIGGGYQAPDGSILHPITAPALIIVGYMMIEGIKRIDWSDATEAIPSFLTVIGIPLTFNIADGLAMGFVSYPILKLLAGKGKQVTGLVYFLAVIFILRYGLLR